MIVTENITVNGKKFTKKYSDKGMMLERNGVYYSEALDPAEFDRLYNETDITAESTTKDATEEDYQDALGEFGVEI